MNISRNKLKELAAYRLQKHCDEEAVFVVEGPKMATEALCSGFGIRTLCATEAWLAANAGRLEQAAVRDVYEVGQAELQRLSHMKSPDSVWILADRSNPAHLQHLHSAQLTLALDRLQDPGNMGTILRTADWYGVRRIVCSRDTVSQYNPKVVQASMGAVFRTKVEYTDLCRWLQGCGKPIYGASLHGVPLEKAAPIEEEAVLLIGNESRGISAEALALCTHTCFIPNLGGTAESLNAAVATGILIHHFCTKK